MNLKIKVSCDPGSEFAKMLANNLLEVTNNAILVKNGIIIEPLQSKNGTYIIPELINEDEYSLLLDATENGGLDDEDNFAQIVCGLSGKPLKAYFIPSKNVIQCRIHANFSVPNGCVIIQAMNNMITIIEGKIEHNIEQNIAKLNKTELYNGVIELLPKELNKFKLAAEVAVDKSNCKYCTHVHYYIDTKQLYTKTRKSL